MLLGIITDIHEEIAFLDEAIHHLRSRNIDELIFLGDLCNDGQHLNETCQRFQGLNYRGVWGNHDYGLCEDARLGKLTRYDAQVTKVAASLLPSIQIERLYCSHVEPWLDPEKIEDLWYLGGLPESTEHRDRIFANSSWDIAFAGHFHRWLWLTTDGISPWNGEHPLDLSTGRHYIIIDACFNGSCATFDTETKVLTPICWTTDRHSNEGHIARTVK